MNTLSRHNFLSSFVIILLLLTAGVEASYTVLSKGEQNNDYELTVPVVKGWNMLMGLTSPHQISASSNLQSEDIKVIYAFLQDEKRYARLFPDTESQYTVPYAAQWVLVRKTGDITYRVAGIPTLEKGFPLKKGWNFVGLTPEFLNEFLGVASYQGTCSIERSYFWNWLEQYQRWDSFILSTKLTAVNELGSVPIGHGIVLNVEEDCVLGETIQQGPPALPSESASGGSCCVVGTGSFAFFSPITQQECESLGKQKEMNVRFVDSLSRTACDSVRTGQICTDSDSSVDYNAIQFAMYDDLFTKGSVLGSDGTTPDQCKDAKTLQEGFCTMNNQKSLFTVQCSLGCDDGACIR